MALTVDAKAAALTEISAVNGTTGKTSTNLTVTASATGLLASLCFDGSANLGSIAMHWDATSTNVAMTQIGTTTYVAGVGQIALFGLVSPVSGAKTLKATWTGTGTGYMASMSFAGSVSSSVAAAFTNFNSATPTGSTGTFNITGASGNYAFAVKGTITPPTRRSSMQRDRRRFIPTPTRTTRARLTSRNLAPLRHSRGRSLVPNRTLWQAAPLLRQHPAPMRT